MTPRGELLEQIAERDGWACFYCGVITKQGTDDRSVLATVDHVIPRFLGGGDGLNNLRVACYECNQKKGAFLPRRMLSRLERWSLEDATDQLARANVALMLEAASLNDKMGHIKEAYRVADSENRRLRGLLAGHPELSPPPSKPVPPGKPAELFIVPSGPPPVPTSPAPSVTPPSPPPASDSSESFDPAGSDGSDRAGDVDRQAGEQSGLSASDLPPRRPSFPPVAAPTKPGKSGKGRVHPKPPVRQAAPHTVQPRKPKPVKRVRPPRPKIGGRVSRSPDLEAAIAEFDQLCQTQRDLRAVVGRLRLDGVKPSDPLVGLCRTHNELHNEMLTRRRERNLQFAAVRYGGSAVVADRLDSLLLQVFRDDIENLGEENRELVTAFEELRGGEDRPDRDTIAATVEHENQMLRRTIVELRKNLFGSDTSRRSRTAKHNKTGRGRKR